MPSPWHCEVNDERPRDASRHPQLRCWLPPLNFITIHYAYFITVCLISSLIFWGSSSPAQSISYTDSLFLVVSAMTESGLNTVNLSQMTTWQQIMLFLLIIFGSSIWVSIWTIMARKHVFEKRFRDVVRAEQMRRATRPGTTVGLSRLQRFLPFWRLPTISSPRFQVASSRMFEHPEPLSAARPHQPGISPNNSNGDTGNPSSRGVTREGPFALTHIGFADAYQPRGAVATAAEHHGEECVPTRRHRDGEDGIATNKKHELGGRDLFAHGCDGRNSQFHGLTNEERERLGGCEYQALWVLSIVVPLYFVLWQVCGCVALGAWISRMQPEAPLRNGISPWWLGIFNGASAFNNSGMSLLDANMVPFQESGFVLVTMGLMILAGNTAYPVFLRLVIWSLRKLLVSVTREDEATSLKDTLAFILQYPRRVYTHLFPARPTWWLVFMLILLNSIDWAGFELLNIGNPGMQHIPSNYRVLDGLFQALAVRSGGFYVVSIPSVYIGLQVLYVVMMYISVYPVVITMRHSNVYEERSLGIYTRDEVPDVGPELTPTLSTHSRHNRGNTGSITALGRAIIRKTLTLHGVGARPPPSTLTNQGLESHISFIGQQIHGQLAHDLWWLVLAILVIVTINTDKFLADPVNFSVFNVIFEVVSAYGCVGISVGVPQDAYSFSGSWHTAAKLVLCAVMLRGRHRGLPVALDRAVRLPGEEMQQEEEEDYQIRRSATGRRASMDP
ncbi:cation transport protein-domain-containing protein [Chaetomium sp. MPI-SDFR-AT-0129]|nr:cation transport protein-domain-containing protein [Chaetomium sp. MPI-SDFR-AT-0129]